MPCEDCPCCSLTRVLPVGTEFENVPFQFKISKGKINYSWTSPKGEWKEEDLMTIRKAFEGLAWEMHEHKKAIGTWESPKIDVFVETLKQTKNEGIYLISAKRNPDEEENPM